MKLCMKKTTIRRTSIAAVCVLASAVILALCFYWRAQYEKAMEEYYAEAPSGFSPSLRFEGIVYITDARFAVLTDGAGLRQVGTIESRVQWDQPPAKDHQANWDLVGCRLYRKEGDDVHLYLEPKAPKEDDFYTTYVPIDYWEEELKSFYGQME